MNHVIFLIVLIYTTFTTDLIKAKECVTPYKENATCLPINDCDVISSALFTLTPRAVQFYKDSQCGCDSGMVCCGTSNNKPYQPLINCVPEPQPMNISLSRESDASVCGLDSSTDRILGGDLVGEGAFPWLAALEYENKFTKENAGIRCGGSLITPRFVLTAAHCILDVEFELIKVWLGVSNLSSEETCFNSLGKPECFKSVEKLNVAKAIPHQFYNSINKFNDIGILELERPGGTYSEFIRPICLPSSDFVMPRMGTLLTVVGWGATENGRASEVKLKVQVPLRENKICQDYLTKRYRNITSKQLCVGGERGRDSCEGDSGGPLMYDFVGANGDVQWIQQGIVSYGTGCGVQGKPGVYTKVSTYAKWITNTIWHNWADIGLHEPCKAYNGTVGTCAPLNTCPGILSMILSKSEYQSQVGNDIQCSQNTFVPNPLVCCEKPGPTISYDINTTPVLPDKATCGILQEDPGVKDDKTNFPWIAGIEVSQNNSNQIRCVGTVISSRYVMASTNCVFGKKDDTFEPIKVWLGRWNNSNHNNSKCSCRKNTCRKIGIKKIIPYPRVTEWIFHFHALILLENEIKFSDYISPICLASDNLSNLEDGESVAGIMLLNSSTTEALTSSKNIVKQEFSVSECATPLPLDQAGNAWSTCKIGEIKQPCGSRIPHGIPIMRKYRDKASGRMQWYLVTIFEVLYKCEVVNIPFSTRNIIRCFDWILTVMSEHN